MLISLPTLAATRSLASETARHLEGRELLLLSGELGAGKTTFVRYLAASLGIERGWVNSPSFTLVQQYPAGKRGIGIAHVDLYRLPPGSELESLGLEEILAGDDLVVVEWPASGQALWEACARPVLRFQFGWDAAGARFVRRG